MKPPKYLMANDEQKGTELRENVSNPKKKRTKQAWRGVQGEKRAIYI